MPTERPRSPAVVRMNAMMVRSATRERSPSRSRIQPFFNGPLALGQFPVRPQMPHRRQVVSGVLVQLGDVEVGFRVVRIHGDRLGIRGERFLEPPLVLEGDSEIVCRRGMVRFHGEDDAVVLDGLGGYVVYPPACRQASRKKLRSPEYLRRVRTVI